MSQVDAFTIPGSPLTMAQLAARLEALFGAAVSVNRGPTAPTNPVLGMVWWDTSAAPLEVMKVYRAVGWRSILSLNVNSGLLTWGGTIGIAQGGTGAETAPAARTALGLGTAAVQPDNRYAHRANNLSDLPDAEDARENIGAHNATNLTTGTLAAARLPFMPVQQGGFPNVGTNKIHMGWTGARVRTRVDSTDFDIVTSTNGSGANGTWVRYSDGTQICWVEGHQASGATEARGNVWRSAMFTWTFPVAFAVAPVATGLVPGTDRWMQALDTTTSALVYRQYSPVSQADLFASRIMAVGRWF
jgi:hypothetical protein